MHPIQRKAAISIFQFLYLGLGSSYRSSYVGQRQAFCSSDFGNSIFQLEAL